MAPVGLALARRRRIPEREPPPFSKGGGSYPRHSGTAPVPQTASGQRPRIIAAARLAAFFLGIFSVLPATAQNREILGEFRIGLVGRDRENPIYEAIRHGAREAARTLSEKYSIDVELRSLTPRKTQTDGQAAALGQLFVDKADGFLISPDPDNANALRKSLRFATRQGQHVVFVESAMDGIDALASLVANEKEAGRLAAKAILPRLQTGARVALLTTENPTPALRQRLEGARSVLGFRRIQKTVRCRPNYASAVQAIREAHKADRNDRIEGWLFLGDWPLAGLPAYPWEPGDLPCVAIQATPAAFLHFDREYLDAVIAHPYEAWGRRGVEILVERLFNETPPESSRITTDPEIIDFRNIGAYREKWRKWL